MWSVRGSPHLLSLHIDVRDKLNMKLGVASPRDNGVTERFRTSLVNLIIRSVKNANNLLGNAHRYIGSKLSNPYCMFYPSTPNGSVCVLTVSPRSVSAWW